MAAKRETDTAAGLYADAPTSAGIASEDWSNKAVFTAVAIDSQELEAIAEYIKNFPIDPIFVDEQGREIPKALTPAEKAALAEHFSDADWRTIEQLMR